ncbi:MAG: TonB family protein [Longimicrobiaceae bacterium]
MVRVRSDGGETLLLVPGSELGAGGQATVYPVPGRPDRVAKIYHDPAPEQELKLRRMIAHPPAGASAGGSGAGIFAWPLELLRGEDGGLVGFLLPRVDGRLRVFELYNPATRRERAPLFHHGLLHRAARSLAAAFDRLHEAGFVVGDVNESNILVGEDGRVVLIDTDSFQVRDPVSGTVYRCPVGRPEFTPPELRERSFAETDRAPEHDRFGLGVLVFQMLMEGTHPFAGRFRGEGEPPPVEERIAAGLFPYAPRDGVELEPPRTAPPFQLLDPGVRALLGRCFVDGHRDPAARPSAAEWRDALAAAGEALVACARNEQHRHAPHLGDCPWCERARRLEGRDPFPSALAVQRGEHSRRAAPVRATRRREPARAATAAVRPSSAARFSGWLLGALLVAGLGLASPSLGLSVAAVVAGMLLVRWWRSMGGLARGGLVTAILAGLTVLIVATGFFAGADDPGVPWEPSTFSVIEVDRKPVLLNPERLPAMVALLRREREDTLIPPFSNLQFPVDESGQIDPEYVTMSWGIESESLDRARFAFLPLRFAPGVWRGKPVRTRVGVPLQWTNGRATALVELATWHPGVNSLPEPVLMGDSPLRGGRRGPDIPDVKPMLLNSGEVRALLARTYPPLLRDAGVTGRADLKFVIDTNGRVVPSSITVVSATHEEFAEASTRVAAGMRFSSAMMEGDVTPVLVQIPISWTLER